MTIDGVKKNLCSNILLNIAIMVSFKKNIYSLNFNLILFKGLLLNISFLHQKAKTKKIQTSFKE